ncbi:hypothetical protein ACFLQI_00200 [Candidatus Undinarchaeota archaeon]
MPIYEKYFPYGLTQMNTFFIAVFLVVAEMAIMKYMLRRGMVELDLFLAPMVVVTFLYGPTWGAIATNVMLWYSFFIRPDDIIPTFITSLTATLFCFAFPYMLALPNALSTIIVATIAYDVVLNIATYPFYPAFMDKLNTVMASTFISYLFYTKLAILFLAF